MHNGTCAVTLDTFWNEMPSMSELQVAGRDTCIIFLTAAEIFPGVVSPFWQQRAGASSSSEAIGSYGSSFDEDSVTEWSRFNDEECRQPNFPI